MTGSVQRDSSAKRDAGVAESSNIAAIYGIEESDGRNFLVMELVPGETLAERIRRGPIPVDEALPSPSRSPKLSRPLTRRGIIHRDLKPANIKITPRGQCEGAGFRVSEGLCRRRMQEVNLSNSPTLSMAATNAGVILGTAAYMRPEQAVGKTTVAAPISGRLAPFFLKCCPANLRLRGSPSEKSLRR